MFLIIPHSALNPLRQKLATVVVSDGPRGRSALARANGERGFTGPK